MGAADVVPGVSGGTIAFITGIYDTLLESIRRINPSLFSIWKKDGFKAAFNHINGFFLISLFAGIFTSIATLAKLISWLLETHPIPIWSFFFGLILVSVYHIIRQVEKRDAIRFVALLIGIGFAYSITVLKPLHMEPTAINTILAGAIAICAMILPGISGSFILLLIGMYAPVLGAVKGFQIDILALFLVGCVADYAVLLSLVVLVTAQIPRFNLNVPNWLNDRYATKDLLWKETLTWRTNSKGEQVPLLEQNLSPFEFEHITSQPSQLLLAVLMMLAAIALVLGLEKFADSNK